MDSDSNPDSLVGSWSFTYGCRSLCGWYCYTPSSSTDLVPLLHLLHLTVLVPQLCPLVLNVLLCDLPEGIDLVLWRAKAQHKRSSLQAS